MPNITTSQVDKDFAKVAKLRQINLVTLVENAQEHTKVSQILNIPSQVANVTKFRQINLATLVESVTLTIIYLCHNLLFLTLKDMGTIL